MIAREQDGGQRQNAKRKRRRRKWMPEAEAEAEAEAHHGAVEVTSARSFAWPKCLRSECDRPMLSDNGNNAQ
jgi:hypothetical protein